MKHIILYGKILTIILLIYSLIGGLLFEVPALPILHETIRNIYFHVPMWFSMIFILLVSFVYSILYLNQFNHIHFLIAQQCVKVGILFGILGIVTGVIWAKFTWGAFWSGDPKQNASAAGLLMYMGYILLNQSFREPKIMYKVCSTYNVIAFCMFIPLIIILPRMTDSLHPGSGGNPGFNTYDLDANLRKVFYPAVIGWIGLSIWLVSIKVKIALIKETYYK